MKLQLAQAGLVGLCGNGQESKSHHYLRASAGPPPGSNDFRRRMKTAGEALAARKVGAIVLVHSSFAALDARHLFLALARLWPAGRALARHAADQIVAGCSHDAGQYTTRFAALFERALADRGNEIPVRLVQWSGESHHLGRADAAVRLIDELAALELPPERRVMLWGHGQAGNVLALLSGLLSSNVEMLDRFFAAAQVYYRLPATGVIDVPVWHRVRQTLLGDSERLARRPLDLITFGTPLRYGWRRRAGDELLHFVNHRPSLGTAMHLAPAPLRHDDLALASAGDYVQQLAVPGTDTPPSRFAWRSWLADRRLGRLFDAENDRANVADRLTCGMRVPDAGTTLLVDYGRPAGPLSEHLAGHAVYTRQEWLLFHLEQVAQRLGDQASAVAHAA